VIEVIVYQIVERTSRKVIYVGKASGSYRFRDHMKFSRGGASYPIYERIRELDYMVDFVIVNDNISEEDASRIEVDLINQYGLVSEGTGSLYNMRIGSSMTESLRSKISKSLVGRVWSSEAREKLSVRMKGSNDHRQAVKAVRLSDNSSSRFSSLSECLKWLNSLGEDQYNYQELRRKSTTGERYKGFVFCRESIVGNQEVIDEKVQRLQKG
jgi:hypothetical protein